MSQRKVVLHAAIIAGLFGVAFVNITALIFSSLFFAWYAMEYLKWDLLNAHRSAMSDSELAIDDQMIALSDCALEQARYGLDLAIPPILCVRQYFAWRDPMTGDISQFMAKTNIGQKTSIRTLAVTAAS